MIEPVEIDTYKPRENPVTYTVCTLVSNPAEYRTMLDSYENAGFTKDICEFLYIDNSAGNKYDAYAGLNKMIALARGLYIIFSHQDVELKFDTEETLRKRLREIDQTDARWAVLSNAGALDMKTLFKRISHPDHELNEGPFPARVTSVDENFILLKKSAGLNFSLNLSGFHFYGTDLCLQAELKGYTCYVIDFHLFHKSTGNLNEAFYAARRAFIKSYSGKIKARFIRTPCTIMFISGNSVLNYLMNRKSTITLFKFLKKTEIFWQKHFK